MWNRNWKPEQSVSDGVDPKMIQIDQPSIIQFDSVLDDLLDENKIELASRAELNLPTPIVSPMKSVRKESPTPTIIPGRRSLFTFADSPRKTESSSSADTGDGGFFTDMNPRKHSERASPRPIIPNLMTLRKNSIESFTPAPPKRSTTIEETRLQMDEHSRPGSSLSSASLPVSIISSQPDLITQPSISRHPKAVLAPKKFRVEYSKKSSPPNMVIEGKKVTSDEHHPRTKISSGVLPKSSYQSQHLMKTSSTSSITTVTRDESARQKKLEFSVRDSLPMSSLTASKVIKSRPSTPSNTSTDLPRPDLNPSLFSS